MKIQNLFGMRIKEDPKDAELISHKLLVRAGYLRQNATGIYSYLPLLQRVLLKITEIIREEMNAIDGQEILMPLAQPREMWEKTGRYQTIKDELLRFSDRWEKEMVLAMTHEEAVSFLAKTELSSYKQLPVMVYQIQLKFRDEPRCRGGIIRVREFTMKDGYSFHRDEESLKKYYDKVYNAYEKIFKRAGLRNFIAVQADPGMMGGRISHEFMLLVPSGEDTIVYCDSCGYKANKEVATSVIERYKEDLKELKLVETPQKKTIEEVANFLGYPENKTVKAVFYADDKGKLYLVLIRGDREVNETRLKKLINTTYLRFADENEIFSCGAVPGYASCLGVKKDLNIYVDKTVLESNNLVAGANKEGYHYINFNFERDVDIKSYTNIHIESFSEVLEGDLCPDCNSKLKVTRGIEIGNIFQLGDKYTRAYDVKVLDENGKAFYPVMGCYGIGVGRLAGSIVEESYDDKGIIWPITVAPFEIHIVALNQKNPVVYQKANQLYDELIENNFEVLLDDREESAGVKFADADLIGIPFQIIISPKLIEKDQYEIKIRKTGEKIIVDKDKLIQTIGKMINEEYLKYQVK
ncbi:MAG: proline--tRNA ligase [Exilispira sp.]